MKKETLAELIRRNPNPDAGYVLDEVILTSSERAEWQARRDAETAAADARRAAIEAVMPSVRAAIFSARAQETCHQEIIASRVIGGEVLATVIQETHAAAMAARRKLPEMGDGFSGD